jgi:hypothetical protein
MMAWVTTLAMLAQADAGGGNWITKEGSIAAAASVLTAIAIKLMDMYSASTRGAQDDATAIRAELRQETRDLRDRLDRTERRLERYRARCVALESEVASYTAHCAYLTTLLHQNGVQVEVKMPVSRVSEMDEEDEEDDGSDTGRRRRAQ